MISENLGGGFEVIDKRGKNKDAGFVNALKDKKEKLRMLGGEITKLEDELQNLRDSRSESRDKGEKDKIWEEEQEKTEEIKRLKKEKRDLLDSESKELDIEEAEIFAEQAVKAKSFDEFVDVLEKSGRDDVEQLINNIGIYQEYGRDETLDYIRGDHIIRECDLGEKINEWAEELKEDSEKNTGLPVEPMTETEIETEEKPAEEVVEVGIVSLAEKLGVELDDKSKNGIEELEKIKSGETEINADNVEKVQLFLREFFSGQIENQKTENEKEKEILEKTKSLYYGVMKSFVERRAELEKGEKREKSPSVKIREGIGLAVKEEVLESEEDLSRAKERIEKLGELKKKLKERVKYLEEEKNQDEAEKVKEKINEINDEIGKLKKKFNEAMAERGIKETESVCEVLEGGENLEVETEGEPETVGESVGRLEELDRIVKETIIKLEDQRGEEVEKLPEEKDKEKVIGRVALIDAGIITAESTELYSSREVTRKLQEKRAESADLLLKQLHATKESLDIRYRKLEIEKFGSQPERREAVEKFGFLNWKKLFYEEAPVVAETARKTGEESEKNKKGWLGKFWDRINKTKTEEEAIKETTPETLAADEDERGGKQDIDTISISETSETDSMRSASVVEISKEKIESISSALRGFNENDKSVLGGVVDDLIKGNHKSESLTQFADKLGSAGVGRILENINKETTVGELAAVLGTPRMGVKEKQGEARGVQEQKAQEIEVFFKGIEKGATGMGPKAVKEYDERIRAVMDGKPIKEGDVVEQLKKDFSQWALGEEWSPDFNFDNLEKRREVQSKLLGMMTNVRENFERENILKSFHNLLVAKKEENKIHQEISEEDFKNVTSGDKTSFDAIKDLTVRDVKNEVDAMIKRLIKK